MSDNQDALKLAELIERDYHDETLAPRMAAAELRRLHAENESLKAELAEQARLVGMGGEREARLRALSAELAEALTSFTRSDYIKAQHPKRCAKAVKALAKVRGEQT